MKPDTEPEIQQQEPAPSIADSEERYNPIENLSEIGKGYVTALKEKNNKKLEELEQKISLLAYFEEEATQCKKDYARIANGEKMPDDWKDPMEPRRYWYIKQPNQEIDTLGDLNPSKIREERLTQKEITGINSVSSTCVTKDLAYAAQEKQSLKNKTASRVSGDNAGKWVLQYNKQNPQLDEDWKKILRALKNGDLHHVKATPVSDRYETQAIIVSTTNYLDHAHVHKVYQFLIDSGIPATSFRGYKRDQETIQPDESKEFWWDLKNPSQSIACDHLQTTGIDQGVFTLSLFRPDLGGKSGKTLENPLFLAQHTGKLLTASFFIVALAYFTADYFTEELSDFISEITKEPWFAEHAGSTKAAAATSACFTVSSAVAGGIGYAGYIGGSKLLSCMKK